MAEHQSVRRRRRLRAPQPEEGNHGRFVKWNVFQGKKKKNHVLTGCGSLLDKLRSPDR